VDICPVADTLEVTSLISKKPVPKKKIAVAVVSLFLLVTGIGVVSGHWQNNVSRQEYLHHIKYMDSYGHPTSTQDVKEFNEKSLHKNPR